MARRKKADAAKAPTPARVFEVSRLREIVDEAGGLMDERNEIQARIKDLKKQARAEGFALAPLNRVIAESRAKDKEGVKTTRVLEELYRQALGLTPIEAAIQETAPNGSDKGADKSGAKSADAGAGEGATVQ